MNKKRKLAAETCALKEMEDEEEPLRNSSRNSLIKLPVDTYLLFVTVKRWLIKLLQVGTPSGDGRTDETRRVDGIKGIWKLISYSQSASVCLAAGFLKINTLLEGGYRCRFDSSDCLLLWTPIIPNYASGETKANRTLIPESRRASNRNAKRKRCPSEDVW